jgi:hypothetical protein
MIRSRTLSFAIVAAVSWSTLTADVATITKADLSSVAIDLREMNDAAIVGVHPTTGEPMELALRDVVEVRNVTATEPSSRPDFLAIGRSGQRWTGVPVEIRDDLFVWESPSLGRLTLPIAAIAQIRRTGSMKITQNDGGSTQDELRLANGDHVRGIVTGGDPKNLNVQAIDGQPVVVAWANVRVLTFTATQAASPKEHAFRVELNDQTVLAADSISITADTAKLSIDTRETALPVGVLRRVQQTTGGATQMLAWSVPAAVKKVSFFPGRSVDLSSSVDGLNHHAEAASANDALTAIVVRPKSTLSWKNPQAGSTFSSRFVVPAGRAYADVTLRVRSGDRVVFEKEHVRSGDPPLSIEAVIESEKLSLEVDFGANFDVQDEAIWLDPRITLSAQR